MKKLIKTIFLYLGLGFELETHYGKLFFNKILKNDKTDKFFYFKKIFNKLSNIEGDIVECGVGKSITFQILSLLLSKEKNKRKLWGFDSFEGFPEPTIEDKSSRNSQKGEWALITPERVLRNLLSIGISQSFIDLRIRLVKGFFETTLPNSEISKIALLHLDADLYQSYKDCLEYLYPKVVRGGVVMFDEYKNEKDIEKWPGAAKAIDEYFKDKNQEIIRDKKSGKYFLIKK